MIDPRSVEVFYWVVQLGGFRRAAEKLATTQPAVSARVAGLEAAIGARLLDRGQRRRITLTPQGVRLLAYAERLLALQAEMQAAFAAPGALHGTIRLGVAETIVHTWLSPLLRRLHDAYPRLEVDIMVDISANLRTALLGGEIDLALLLGPIAAPGFHDIPIGEYRLAWIARAGLPLGPEPLDLETLARHPIITYARATRPHQQLRELFAGRPPPRIFANASLSSTIRMVLDGIGIGLVAPATIAAELADGSLRILDATPVLEPLYFTASWRDAPGATLAATVATMAKAVADEHRPATLIRPSDHRD